MSPIIPGTVVMLREQPPPRSAPTDTGQWFVAGLAERGKQAPTLVTNMTEFERLLGARVSYSVLWDAAEAFFREGGARLWVSRVVGPAKAAATVNLMDAGAAISLVVTANSAGDWANGATGGLTVEVETGGVTAGSYVLIIRRNGVEVERTPELVDQDAAVAWAQANSNYVVITKGVSLNDPADSAVANLTGGADDRASVTDTQWLAALDLFSKDLGPGQVSMPGRTTPTAHGQVLDHAATHNRIALLDPVDSTSPSVVKASGTSLRTLGNARYGGMFGPWAQVPGLLPGTLRDVPYTAIEAGIIARNDAMGMSPNDAAAGVNGQPVFAVGLKDSGPADGTPWTDAERDDLYQNGGVNVAISKYGGIRTYGFRTLVNPTTLPNFTELGAMRTLMAIQAKGDAIAEGYVLRTIDGGRLIMGEYAGELTAMLSEFYRKRALFGETPEDAFRVDVGPSVNTDQTIAGKQLKAVIAVRVSPMAELVYLEIVKVATTEAVA